MIEDDGREWRPTLEAPDSYLVSNDGHVYSLLARKTVAVGQNGSGYRFVRIMLDGKQRTRFIHRLMLEAFVGSPPTLVHQTAHLNGVRGDNRIENLTWATPKENAAHKVLHGTDPVGERHPRAKLRERDVEFIREIAFFGVPIRRIARYFEMDAVPSVARHGGMLRE